MIRFRQRASHVAVGVLALVVGASIAFQPAASWATSGDLLPDLGALPPRNISIDTVRVKGRIENRLRFDTLMANTGTGALELFPGDPGCDPNAGTATRQAWQRVFNANGSAAAYPVGCMVYHPKHHHWHVEGFAAYRLYPMSSSTVASNPVATSNKVSFCMLDMEQVPGVTPAPKRYTACGPNATMGISVGWADNYYSGLADQWIVLPSQIADGPYCLVNIGNVAAVEYVRSEAGAPLPGLIDAVHTHASNAKGVQINLSSGGSAVAATTTPCLPTVWANERTTASDTSNGWPIPYVP